MWTRSVVLDLERDKYLMLLQDSRIISIKASDYKCLKTKKNFKPEINNIEKATCNYSHFRYNLPLCFETFYFLWNCWRPQPEPKSSNLQGNIEYKTEKSPTYANDTKTPPDIFKIRFVNFEPKQMICPHCHKSITTQLKFEAGEFSWSCCICCVLSG